jgi:O-succinylbenzoic acid--CoA ligase
MSVLIEQRDAERLDEAWATPATFALLPERSAVTEDWAAARLAELPDHLREGCFALLTSGSTGRPKLVVGRRDRAEALACVIHEAQGNHGAREALVALPLSYSFAFVNQWVWSRKFGRPLRVTAGLRDPQALRSALRDADGAMLCLVGVQGRLIVDAFAAESFPGVAGLHFAGGRFPQEHLPRLRKLFPAAMITNNFGCAEAMPRLTVRPGDAADDAADVGPPLHGVELRCGESGRLEFKSPYRAVAVIDEDAMRTIPDTEWIPTGDVAELGRDGHWRVVGRAHEVFKRHGEKVMVSEILKALIERWDGAVASYRARDRRGEDGWVLVVAPEPQAVEVRSLLRVLRERFPRAQWPLRIEGLPSLPQLPNGKVDARSLVGASAATIEWDQRA